MLDTFAKFTKFFNIFQNLLNFSLSFDLIFKNVLSFKMFSKLLSSYKHFSNYCLKITSIFQNFSKNLNIFFLALSIIYFCKIF